jgi:HD-GYP domain-containing protein (c-di-GMP phosphodiesterase class II)
MSTSVETFDAVRALAFIGDLSMGQPTDHSVRTAWIARKLALASGRDDEQAAVAHGVAMLRWSGCTANAAEAGLFFGDDVTGRAAMVAEPEAGALAAKHAQADPSLLRSMVDVHCDVSGAIAAMLKLGSVVEMSLRLIFERYDGTGAATPRTVFEVAVASDLEVFTRVYGQPRAFEMMQAKAGRHYPAELVALAKAHAAPWLGDLDERGTAEDAREDPAATSVLNEKVPLELIADVVDLKLPWMTGMSRRTALLAKACAQGLGLDAGAQERLYRAGLLHGIGRAAVPNAMWETNGPLRGADWERMRLVPYWTARAGRHIKALSDEAELASFCFERLDGNGYFRGSAGQAISREARVIAAAVQWELLGALRPDQAPASPDDKRAEMLRQVQAGGLDDETVGVLLSVTSGVQPEKKSSAGSLSERELQVLRQISRGSSNKDAARALSISPSTVATHVESIFRKLDCSTRAAATLKASASGWL